MDLETLLQGFEKYRKIQGKKELQKLLYAYMNYAIKTDPEQTNQIHTCLQANDLFSKATIFHEKSEIQWYLEHGYKPKDIGSGKAHREKYNEAHGAAIDDQYELYQFVSEKIYGRKLPLTILYMAQPSNEEASFTWFLHLLDHPDDLEVQYVEPAMQLFERCGTKYRNREEFKRKCEDFISECKGREYQTICKSIKK